MKTIPYRAETDEQKEECLKRILEVWKKFPSLRLGQLVVVALKHNDPFYDEDYKLVEALENYDPANYTPEKPQKDMGKWLTDWCQDRIK